MVNINCALQVEGNIPVTWGSRGVETGPVLTWMAVGWWRGGCVDQSGSLQSRTLHMSGHPREHRCDSSNPFETDRGDE
jgi:hypothetical protein